jgi:hypothetical protein
MFKKFFSQIAKNIKKKILFSIYSKRQTIFSARQREGTFSL